MLIQSFSLIRHVKSNLTLSCLKQWLNDSASSSTEKLLIRTKEQRGWRKFDLTDFIKKEEGTSEPMSSFENSHQNTPSSLRKLNDTPEIFYLLFVLTDRQKSRAAVNVCHKFAHESSSFDSNLWSGKHQNIHVKVLQYKFKSTSSISTK